MFADLPAKWNFSHFLAPITTGITVITSIVYITMFAASIERRVALVEQRSTEIQTQLEDSNTQQNDQQNRFMDEVHHQFARLDDKIDKIYGILVDKKNNENESV